MRRFLTQSKTLVLGTVLGAGLGFAGPAAAEGYMTAKPTVPEVDAQKLTGITEEGLRTGKPTGHVGEVGTARSNQPHGDEVQELKPLTAEPTGKIGEVGTERENLPTEDEA